MEGLPWWNLRARRIRVDQWCQPPTPCEFCGHEYSGGDGESSEGYKQSQIAKAVRQRDEFYAKVAAGGTGAYAYVTREPLHEVAVIDMEMLGTGTTSGLDHPCVAVRLARWLNPVGSSRIDHYATTEEPDFEVRRAMWSHPEVSAETRARFDEEFAEGGDVR